MPESEGPVELRPAFTWDCPRCEKTNFVSAAIPELSPEDMESLKADGFQPSDLAAAAQMPQQVRCKACGRYFDSREFGAEDGEQDLGTDSDSGIRYPP